MEIIIGREAGAVSPRLCLTIGSSKQYISATPCVPKSVSRTHCKLEVDAGGTMTITNVSGHNTLFVNGLEYMSKSVGYNDLIELGTDRYKLNLKAVITAAGGGGAPTSEVCDISSLKKIWDNYEQSKMDIQIKERKINAYSAIPGVFSMISIALSFIDGCRYVFLSVAIFFAVLFWIIRRVSVAKVPLELKDINDRFQDEYICPNCKHFLGILSYKVILRNGYCPYCRCKFKE